MMKACTHIRDKEGLIFVWVPLTETITLELLKSIKTLMVSDYDKVLCMSVVTTACYGLFHIGELLDSSMAKN